MEQDFTFVNKIILPAVGRKYSGTTSRGLIWLENSQGHAFPCHYLKKPQSQTVILYAHGNGGTLGDFKPIVQYYYDWFEASIMAIEYPGYGPAEGTPSEASVNDNLSSAYVFLVHTLRYSPARVVLMGYSIGSGPTIRLGADLCCGRVPGPRSVQAGAKRAAAAAAADAAGDAGDAGSGRDVGSSSSSTSSTTTRSGSSSERDSGSRDGPPCPPLAVVTVAAFMSVKDIVRDMVSAHNTRVTTRDIHTCTHMHSLEDIH